MNSVLMIRHLKRNEFRSTKRAARVSSPGITVSTVTGAPTKAPPQAYTAWPSSFLSPEADLRFTTVSVAEVRRHNWCELHASSNA